MGNEICLHLHQHSPHFIIRQPHQNLLSSLSQYKQFLLVQLFDYKQEHYAAIEVSNSFLQTWTQQLLFSILLKCQTKQINNIQLKVLSNPNSTKDQISKLPTIFESSYFVKQFIEYSSNQHDFYSFCIGEQLFFNFVERADYFNFKKQCNLANKLYLNVMPQEYLQITLNRHVIISKVNSQQNIPISRTPFNEDFNIKIIQKTLRKEQSQILQFPLQIILNQIFMKGNSDSADLLVEDLCSPQHCAVLGLPPKLIASSLAKYAKQQIVSSTIWDQLQSTLVAFAINLGQLINEQIHMTKIRKVLFRTQQFNSYPFLHAIQTMVGNNCQIWFIDSKQLKSELAYFI